ncbi:type II toxin-antitoxin system HicB family antitoxin [Burkholderia pyrrocinia]|uniref:Type II toxin-antitoxin system HicB family antitoxin n=1 Tax=Burkholderia pyrrocinia TaxID=60550 RepID=A0ABZ3BNX4_BURPY
MTNTISYKGFYARVEFDRVEQSFVGRVVGVLDRITFRGDTVASLIANFHSAIERHIEFCTKTRRPPMKTATGHLSLKIDPQLHEAVAIAAALDGQGLSQWIESTLFRAVEQQLPDRIRSIASIPSADLRDRSSRVSVTRYANVVDECCDGNSTASCETRDIEASCVQQAPDTLSNT